MIFDEYRLQVSNLIELLSKIVQYMKFCPWISGIEAYILQSFYTKFGSARNLAAKIIIYFIFLIICFSKVKTNNQTNTVLIKETG